MEALYLLRRLFECVRQVQLQSARSLQTLHRILPSALWLSVDVQVRRAHEDEARVRPSILCTVWWIWTAPRDSSFPPLVPSTVGGRLVKPYCAYKGGSVRLPGGREQSLNPLFSRCKDYRGPKQLRHSLAWLRLWTWLCGRML